MIGRSTLQQVPITDQMRPSSKIEEDDISEKGVGEILTLETLFCMNEEDILLLHLAVLLLLMYSDMTTPQRTETPSTTYLGTGRVQCRQQWSHQRKKP